MLGLKRMDGCAQRQSALDSGEYMDDYMWNFRDLNNKGQKYMHKRLHNRPSATVKLPSVL